MSERLDTIRQLASFTSEELRFWSYVSITDDCWEWQGAVGHAGYGFYWFRGRTQKAHRVAMLLYTGEVLLPSDVIRHRCNNHLCVNPGHLLVGTHAENAQDKIDSGHAVGGGKNRKLQPYQRDEIRQRYMLGGITQLKLAQQFGVGIRHVQEICRNADQP